LSTPEAASGFIIISINVDFCKEGFNPSYIQKSTLIDIMIKPDAASGVDKLACFARSVSGPCIGNLSTPEAASGFIIISINVDFCKEGFNPSYIITESYSSSLL
jgi:hypothetical protein